MRYGAKCPLVGYFHGDLTHIQPAVMSKLMPTIRRAYASSRYGQLHYRISTPDQATGAPPLLCLHQTPGNGGEWAPLQPVLAQRRVVIAADTPGYGMSDPPEQPLRIEDFAEIMGELMVDLAEEGIVPQGQFDVMGVHTGSITATQLARSQPDRVRRLVLFGLAAYPQEVRAEKLARLADNFPPPQNDLSHVEKLWALFQAYSDPRMTAEEKHVAMAECLRLGSRMPWAYAAVYRYDFLEALSAIEQRALIVNCQDDLWEVTRRVSDRVRNAERLDLPGVAHGAFAIARDQLVERIEDFLGRAS